MTRAPGERELPLLSVEDLRLSFPAPHGRGRVLAVDGVSLTLHAGQTLALVGESGCGKSSLARAILQLHRPDSGSVRLRVPGSALQPLETLSPRALRRLRRHLQVVFQDPYAALDPRRTVKDTVAEPLEIFGHVKRRQRNHRVAELLALVGLDPALGRRYPHELSGGQRQRVGIARALAAEPQVLICDEAVSALDVSIQVQVLNLLLDLQATLHLAILFITHDLAVVPTLADTLAVMYLGKIVEQGPAPRVLAHPAHPYTQALLSAVPIPDPRRRHPYEALSGDPPSLLEPPRGCAFTTRCPLAEPRCHETPLPMSEVAPDHHARCHLVETG